MPASRLSVGTIDQMYLSLRLSSLKEIVKENVPLILDEHDARYFLMCLCVCVFVFIQKNSVPRI